MATHNLLKVLLLGAAAMFLVYITLTFLHGYKVKLHGLLCQSHGKNQIHESHFLAGGEKCLPLHHLMYLKTYKTGSSSVSCMMYRYALRYNRTIVPVKDDPYPYILNMSVLDNTFNGLPKTGPFDILPEHLRFNKTAVMQVLHPDTVYILSLRHPVDHLISYFKEYKLMDSYGPDRLKLFLHDPQHNKDLRNLPSISAHQCGLENEDKYNMDAINKLITHLDKTFDVIIITEYFNESLVLLRRRLCWAFEDIVYMVLRKRLYSLEEQKIGILSEEEMKTFHNYSIADFMLYNHFLQRLMREITSQPEDYWGELAHFRNVLRLVTAFCQRITSAIEKDISAIFEFTGNLNTGVGRTFIEIKASVWSPKFVVDAVDCAMMALRTRVLRNMVRVRNSPIFCSPKTNRINNIMYDPVRLMSNTSARINHAFCTKYSPYYRLPMEVFTSLDSYMWHIPGLVKPLNYNDTNA